MITRKLAVSIITEREDLHSLVEGTPIIDNQGYLFQKQGGSVRMIGGKDYLLLSNVQLPAAILPSFDELAGEFVEQGVFPA